MTTADALADLCASVRPLDDSAAAAARDRHATLAKPPGSLGRIEDVGVHLSAIAGRCPPPVPSRPMVVVAAADHGVHARGVTPWPQSITTAMVETICAGRASVSQAAAAVGADVRVLDVGCRDEPADHPLLRKARVRAATADLSNEPAMSRQDAAAAIVAGAQFAADLVAEGTDLLVTGDMGIANTTASACLVAVFTGLSAADVTGRGAGIDDATLGHKIAVVDESLRLHRPDPTDALGCLAAVGGLEHAALAGIVLAAAAARVPVVLDGVITNAAALVATAFVPDVVGYLVAGHRSVEPGAAAALAHLGLQPLLDLELRLGEGSGGVLAVPLVVAAARVLTSTATIDDVLGR